MKKISFIRHFALSILIGLLVYWSIGLFPAKAFAGDFSLGVYPPLIQIQATAPVAIRKDITIVNASDSEQDVNIVLKPFTQNSLQNGQVQYLPTNFVTPDRDLFAKIQILDGDSPVTSLALLPKQKKNLTIHIGLPKDELGADYYFSILFISGSTLTDSTSHIQAGIATNVLLSIGSKDKTTGFLQEFSSPWFVQTGPIPFTVLVQNTSRHFISPTGHILIRNMFGQLVGQINFLQVNILGNTSRYIPATVWPEKVLFGPYRANIVIALSDQGPVFTKTVYFFVMPISYIFGFFLAVVLVSIVVVRVRKRIKSI